MTTASVNFTVPRLPHHPFHSSFPLLFFFCLLSNNTRQLYIYITKHLTSKNIPLRNYANLVFGIVTELLFKCQTILPTLKKVGNIRTQLWYLVTMQKVTCGQASIPPGGGSQRQTCRWVGPYQWYWYYYSYGCCHVVIKTVFCLFFLLIKMLDSAARLP